MNILIVSSYLPHPRAGHGTGVFMYGFIKRISSHHQITLLSFCDKRELVLANDLRALPLELITVPRGKGAKHHIGWNVYLVKTRFLQILRSIIFWKPVSVSLLWHPAMSRRIRYLTKHRQYDIVQFETAEMAQYVRHVAKGKKILHEHDVVMRPAYRRFHRTASPFRKLWRYIEWCRWSRYERTVVRKFDRALCVTEQDMILLEKLSGMRSVSYLPRAVDVQPELPEYSSRTPGSILFVGAFSHRPNIDSAIWLLREIFPRVLKQCPDAKLCIIGKNPPRELALMALRYPQVELLGYVDDVDAYFRRSRVFVAPLRFGGGVKMKILHAMAHGLPVVTTKIGAEGIDGINADSIVVMNSAESIAEAVCECLRDPSRASALGRKGWAIARKTYSWEHVLSCAEKIYSEVGG